MPPISSPLKNSSDVIQEILPNGVKLIFIHRPHHHTIHVSAYVKTGARFESAAENGISHFLEHMVFRGTTTYQNAFALNLAFETLGASVNACTTPDETEYTLALPKENAVKGISLLAQMLTTPHFTEMDTERKIVVEEILEDFDEYGQCIDIDSLSRERIWSNGTLSYPITGSIENVSRLEYADIVRWFQTHYVSGNMVICVSGDVLNKTLQSSIRTLFNTIPAGPKNTVDGHRELPSGDRYLHVSKPGSQTQFRLAFRTEGLLHPTYPAIEILLRLIDDGMSTPLHRRIFENLALAYNIGAELEAYEDSGVFNIDAQASHDNIRCILTEAIDIVAEIKRGEFSAQELQKAQNRAAWDLEALQDYPGALNAWYGEQELYRIAIHPSEAVNRIRALDKAAIIHAASHIFTDDNLFITTVGKQSAKQQRDLKRTAEKNRLHR